MASERLIKDETILQLVEHFETKFGKWSFHIKDYWDADLFAIGLTDADDNYLFYISTWMQIENHYYASIEIKNMNEDKPNGLIQEFENVNMQELENIFVQHFTLFAQ